MKLPRLTDDEFDLANSRIKAAGENPLECPTCLSMPNSDDADVRIYGTYRYQGKEHECNCDMQLKLRRHYALANIPFQYMRLDWASYKGNDHVTDEVENYLQKFRYYKALGMGIEFHATELGVGKTFAAIHIGKELVKQGYKVFFIQFQNLVSQLSDKETFKECAKTLESSHVLIIDDITTGFSDAQKHLFSTQLELVVRHRTNWNMPTVITTNLKPDDMNFFYPRIYSLLSAKHSYVEMPGKDKRPGLINEENERIADACETKPIT